MSCLHLIIPNIFPVTLLWPGMTLLWPWNDLKMTLTYACVHCNICALFLACKGYSKPKNVFCLQWESAPRNISISWTLWAASTFFPFEWEESPNRPWFNLEMTLDFANFYSLNEDVDNKYMSICLCTQQLLSALTVSVLFFFLLKVDRDLDQAGIVGQGQRLMVNGQWGQCLDSDLFILLQ